MSEPEPREIEITPDLIDYARKSAYKEAKKRFHDVAKRKDAAQSAVLHLMSRPPKYDPTKGAAVKTLIYTVVQRHVQKYVGREFRHGKRFMQPEPVNKNDQDDAFDPLDHAENRRVKLQTKGWTTDDILEFIDNEDSRALCRLVIECGGNLSETARRLSITEGTVRYRLRMLAPKLLARGFNPFNKEEPG